MNKLYEEASVKAIADAIRLKTTRLDHYRISEMEDAIIERLPFGGIPQYHYQEAGRVIERLRTLKTLHPNNICFGTIADNHMDKTNDNLKASAINASFALETVGQMAPCDFVANLGDNHVGTNIDTNSDYANIVFMERCTRYALMAQDGYSLVGNHEKSNSTEKLYNLMGIYNNFDSHVEPENIIRGYGFSDYADKKVRVIVLNTTDYWNIQGGNGMSYSQKEFLMKALDLSAKTDYASWTIIILSHIPLDFLGGDYNKGADLKSILKAYNDGTTATIKINDSYARAEGEKDAYSTSIFPDGLSYNYSGKNAPKIINIHGHIHTNKYGKLKFIDDNTELDMVRVATPNSSFNGNASTNRYTEYGDYSITTEEANKIKKAANSKADTSATFYLIDLDNQVIYSVGYGADIDRTIPYKDATVYTVTYNLTDVTSSNTSSAIIEEEPYSTTLTVGKDYILDTVKVTMGGADITSTAYSNGVISISNAIGDIVITATAKDSYVPHWDIADRTAVTDMYKAASATKDLSRKNYYYGAARTGVVYYNYITACSVSGNDVTFTGTTKNFGIGVPYHLESGKSYNFSAKASTTGRLGMVVLNADGTLVSGTEKYSSSGTNLSLDFTAPTDESQWVMLIVECYTANSSITYSNVSLTKK